MSFDLAIAAMLESPSLESPCRGRRPQESFLAHHRHAAYPPSQTAYRPRVRNFHATIHILTSLQRCSCSCLMFLLPFTPL